MPDVLDFLKEWLGKMAVAKENNLFLATVNLNNIVPLLSLGKAAHDMALMDDWLNGCKPCSYQASGGEFGHRDVEHSVDCPRQAVINLATELYDNA